MKTLIDIGAHHGEGYFRLKEMIGIDKGWTTHHFEPNPISMTQLLQNLVNEEHDTYFHSLAIGEPSLCPFYLQRDMVSQTEYTLDGFGSCLSTSGSTERGLSFAVTVCVISLSKAFEVIKSDEYHVKIDIEGTEYVLDWQSIPKNAHCYVEWHPYGCDNPKERKAEIMASRPDITWHEWD